MSFLLIKAFMIFIPNFFLILNAKCSISRVAIKKKKKLNVKKFCEGKKDTCLEDCDCGRCDTGVHS